MIQLLAIVACAFGLASTSPSANQYVDNVLFSSLPQELRYLGLNPAPLSNFVVKFGPSGWFKSQAQASFTNGNITGLTNIRRKGDCLGPKAVRNEVTINCTLGIYPVNAGFRVTVKNGTQTNILNNNGLIDENQIYVVFSNYTGVASVKNYRVDRLGQALNPTFTPIPAGLNQYIHVLSDGYRAQVNSQLYQIIQQRFGPALARAASRVPIPRQ